MPVDSKWQEFVNLANGKSEAAHENAPATTTTTGWRTDEAAEPPGMP
jgi:hypothetical protein